MKKNMRFSLLLVILLLFSGMVVLSFPFVANIINDLNQTVVTDSYDKLIENMSTKEIEAEREAARTYNDSLLGNVVLTDPFDVKDEKKEAGEYEKRLNIDNDGVMGYIEIPIIDVKLPIYHGTSEEVLRKGVGHLEKTSLPIGGTGTHAILSAHTAYDKSTLFNNLVKLEEGDEFYLSVLDQKLAYQVNQIKVVEPSNTGDLLIDAEEDYVTLITCTPYGVNSHRLLVRGTRIPYVEERSKQVSVDHSSVDYIPIIIIGIVFILMIGFILRKRSKKKKNLVS